MFAQAVQIAGGSERTASPRGRMGAAADRGGPSESPAASGPQLRGPARSGWSPTARWPQWRRLLALHLAALAIAAVTAAGAAMFTSIGAGAWSEGPSAVPETAWPGSAKPRRASYPRASADCSCNLLELDIAVDDQLGATDEGAQIVRLIETIQKGVHALMPEAA
jgi:hypothetical protein